MSDTNNPARFDDYDDVLQAILKTKKIFTERAWVIVRPVPCQIGMSSSSMKMMTVPISKVGNELTDGKTCMYIYTVTMILVVDN